MGKFFVILSICYTVWVNDNYSIYVCNIKKRYKKLDIEVIEGDGYSEEDKQEESFTYQDILKIMDKKERDFDNYPYF